MTSNSERPIVASGFRPNLAVVQGPGGFDKAEYVTPEASGLESGFYVTDRGLPWHVTLSRRLDTPELMTGAGRTLTAGEALILAGLDFDVEKWDIQAVSPTEGTVDVPRAYATVRTDTLQVLGVVGQSYKVLQNRDAFAFADAIVDDGGAHYETAGSLWGGKVIFLSMEVPDDIHVEGDPSDYRLFLVVSNGHDGKHPVRADVTIERVTCRNTLRISHKRAISTYMVKHYSTLDGRLQDARSALGISFRYAEAFGESASALVATSLVDRQVDAILRDVFPVPEKQDTPERIDQSIFAKVRNVYQTSPSIDPIRGTAYGVLNAVTEYLDHFHDFHGGGASSAEDVKAGSLLFAGSASSYKQDAYDRLTALAERKG